MENGAVPVLIVSDGNRNRTHFVWSKEIQSPARFSRSRYAPLPNLIWQKSDCLIACYLGESNRR